MRIDSTLSFDLPWFNYRNGFGVFNSSFWLGHELLYQLTSRASYRLRIEMQASANNEWFSAEYNTFYIDNETTKYAIQVNGYSGYAGDSLNSQVARMPIDGMPFSTSDEDRSCNCPGPSKGARWFNCCTYGLLNDKYGRDDFYWNTLVYY